MLVGLGSCEAAQEPFGPRGASSTGPRAAMAISAGSGVAGWRNDTDRQRPAEWRHPSAKLQVRTALRVPRGERAVSRTGDVPQHRGKQNHGQVLAGQWPEDGPLAMVVERAGATRHPGIIDKVDNAQAAMSLAHELAERERVEPKAVADHRRISARGATRASSGKEEIRPGCPTSITPKPVRLRPSATSRCSSGSPTATSTFMPAPDRSIGGE